MWYTGIRNYAAAATILISEVYAESFDIITIRQVSILLMPISNHKHHFTSKIQLISDGNLILTGLGNWYRIAPSKKKSCPAVRLQVIVHSCRKHT
jgi:hypothetical protein